MTDLRFTFRQIAGSRRQSIVFVLCVALSMVTLVSLGSFSRSVNSSLLHDARSLHAADIIVHAHSPFSPELTSAVDALARSGEIEAARTWEFYSVVRTYTGDRTLLASLKVVEPGYPFYGKVELASGLPFRQVLAPGGIVVEQGLLDRLHLRIGDRLRVGDASLVIRDVLTREPDRPSNLFNLGPRIFISAADLPSLGLVGKGSRVSFTILVRVDQQKDLDRIVAGLRKAAGDDRVGVDTYQSADSRIKRFFDNLLFFLNLIGMFTLVLAGTGIQSTLTALLKEQERTIAIMKALGAGSRYIIGHYFKVVLLLGLGGTVLGLAVSFALQRILPRLFQGVLPDRVYPTISAGAVGEGLLLGLLIVLLFTALPLYRLREVRPQAIFSREEHGGGWSRSRWLMTGAGLIFFTILVIVRIREVKTGLQFVLGLGILILIAFLCAQAFLRVLRRLWIGNLMHRQALRGLFRQGSATRSILVTLTASLTVLLSINVVEKNLDDSFVSSFPPDAPNLFFIDIQPGQVSGFAGTLGIDTTYYPVIRGSVVSINNEPVDPEKERRNRGDNLSREFNLTCRDYLLPDERITSGPGLFRKDWTVPQVSVLDTVVKMHSMRLGDTIRFRIQGLELDARIASVRTRTKGALQPYFYFVFPESVLGDAPRTYFAAVRVDKERIAPIQNLTAARFPNVSVIDMTETAAVFGRIMERLSIIIRFFTLFSFAAGLLIIIGSVLATRSARIAEAVYYTVLGARRRFVLGVFAGESLILGLMSGLPALVLSQAIGWVVCGRVLDIDYRPYLPASLLIVLATTLLVICAGVGASFPILFQKPASFLREHADE